MAVHSVNRDDLPFRLVSGLVDTDSFHAVGIIFPAVWIDPNFGGTLPRGMPIAQQFVVPRQTSELVCELLDAEHTEAFDNVAEQIKGGPGVYRKARRQKRVVERLNAITRWADDQDAAPSWPSHARKPAPFDLAQATAKPSADALPGAQEAGAAPGRKATWRTQFGPR